MKQLFLSKPYLFFFIVGVITLTTALIYWYSYPEAYFDFSGRHEFSISSAYAWFFFSGYLFGLTGIYYTAVKGRLKVRGWLAATHFVFVILFLLLFVAFSAFNTTYIQHYLAGLPFFTTVFIYALVFILDLAAFVASLLMLLINLISFRRTRE